MNIKQAEPIFVNLKDENQTTIIESMCVSCFENGQSRILFIRIPFFRQLIVTSFHCQHCGYRNNQVQFAGTLPDYGVQILFKALSKQDLNRQIILSEHAKIWIQQIELQMPKLKKAQITTFEGLLRGVIQDLQQGQQQRKQHYPEQYQQIRLYIEKIQQRASGQKFPVSIRIRDPSGNSNIKNPFAPKIDKNLSITQLQRTKQQLIDMGYNAQNAEQQIKHIQAKKMGNKINFTKPFEQSQFMKYQPTIFQVPCHSCQLPGQMKMCQTSVPYFTDMVIMSFVCQYCGAHSTQTKNTGDVLDHGVSIVLKSDCQQDIKRDLFKSQTCAVLIPQLQLQLEYGTLGGIFTTVQGLLEKISQHLGQNNPFSDSDSAFFERMKKLLAQIDQLRQGKKPFTLILKDPLGHSFLQNPYHPEQDKKAKRQQYTRSQAQNQQFGLNDMKVQNYGQTGSIGTGSMKKSKDRRYSQGSVQSCEQIKKVQQFSSPSKEQQPQVKFTKQSPHKNEQN